ncbi:MAG TPA: phosphoglycerate kinase [Acidimicrobiales bacterium]|nr:phosphoglycerate kinase [Acidimicrobiales bacterium]
MGLPVLEDLPDPHGKVVLVRSDLNVPLRASVDKGGSSEIADDFRIMKALPTLKWLAERGANVRVCSHLGRPKGKYEMRLSIQPVRERLNDLIPGIEVLENLRFDPGEESNDPNFVGELIKGCDLFVNDAFGVCHREHASVVGPPSKLPSAAGRLVAREVEMLSKVVDNPVRPLVVMLGGSKVSDKIGLLRSLVDRTDAVLIGGGMSFTFLAALGHEVGDSLIDPSHVEFCRDLIDSGRRIMLPVDVRCLSPEGDLSFSAGGPPGNGTGEVATHGRTIPKHWRGLDIGPETEALYADEISGAGTVFWNGPMGVFEDPRFSKGTETVAKSMAKCGGFTVIGGGDSARAIRSIGLDEEIDHLSSGGGASLQFVERVALPGLIALLAAGSTR